MANLDTLKSSKDLQQYKRMRFLDFLLAFRGWFTRQDLIEEFRVAPAGATRDISEYKNLTSMGSAESFNVDFDDSLKRYVRKDSFEAEYPVSFESGISLLRRALKKGYIGVEDPIPLESPVRLSGANTDVLSVFSRAISNRTCLEVVYGSLSSGDTSRKIIPHSFFESETSWYVRAYCYKRDQFRSFKLTRFSNIKVLDKKGCTASDPKNDEQWQRWVNLILEPHHTQKREVLARDYDMGKVVRVDKLTKEVTVLSECAKEVKVRAAVCGFWLQHWNVDCSDNGELGEQDSRYQLRLANPETLYDVESAGLAPGRNAGEKVI